MNKQNNQNNQILLDILKKLISNPSLQIISKKITSSVMNNPQAKIFFDELENKVIYFSSPLAGTSLYFVFINNSLRIISDNVNEHEDTSITKSNPEEKASSSKDNQKISVNENEIGFNPDVTIKVNNLANIFKWLASYDSSVWLLNSFNLNIEGNVELASIFKDFLYSLNWSEDSIFNLLFHLEQTGALAKNIFISFIQSKNNLTNEINKKLKEIETFKNEKLNILIEEADFKDIKTDSDLLKQLYSNQNIIFYRESAKIKNFIKQAQNI